MKLEVQQKEFYRGLNIVQRAVSKKKTLPILNGVYLETVKDKGIHLIGTDLELGIENWIEADVKEEGTIVLPADHLTNIVRELPNDVIKFNVNLENYQANLKCLSSDFVINGYNPEEFPVLPEVKEKFKLNLPTTILNEIIEEVKFSISSEDTQPALTGSLMIIKEDKIEMVSTNTYRLSYSVRKFKTGSEGKIDFILPGNTLRELNNIISDEEEIELLIDSNHVSFEFNQIKIISRLIEGQFPNFEQVIPDKSNTIIKMNKNEFQMAVKRTSLIARQDSNVISINTEGNRLNINSLDSDTGQAHEEIDIEIKGPEQNINIDAGYLMDVLKILKDEEMEIELIGPLNPLIIKRKDEGGKFIYLIMPVRPES